jgi:hypothetical protein
MQNDEPRRKHPILKLGTWSVKTMCPGLDTSDTTNGTGIRKTSIIDNELTRLNIDIAALQETRIKENGSVK